MTTTTTTDLAERFIQLRAYLMRISPFFSTLLLHTTIKPTTSIPTMAVTQLRNSSASSTPGAILINPDFAATLSDKHFMGVVCHEVLHLALSHLSRASSILPTCTVQPPSGSPGGAPTTSSGVNPPNPTTDSGVPNPQVLLNIAADIIVNGIIESSGLFDLPEGAMTEKSYATLTGSDPYADATLTPKGGVKGLSSWSLPMVYKRVLLDAESLMDEMVGVNLCLTPDDSASAEGAEGTDPHEGLAPDGAWEEILETAKVAESLRGSAKSSEMFRQLSDLQANSSTTDYRSILAQFVFRSSETWDDSYDRRFIHSGSYIDVPHSDTLDLEVYIDTSGSINHSLLQKFLSELSTNLLLSRWASVRFKSWFFDTNLYEGPDSLPSLLSLPQAQIPGGGGTDFGALREKKSSTYVLLEQCARVVLVYTDGWSYNIYDPDFYADTLGTQNVLWIFPPREQTNPAMLELVREMGHLHLHLSI